MSFTVTIEFANRCSSHAFLARFWLTTYSSSCRAISIGVSSFWAVARPAPGALAALTLFCIWGAVRLPGFDFAPTLDWQASADALLLSCGLLLLAGCLLAAALLASLGDARHFHAGRIFALNLGLTPREFSTGGKQRLFGISKRGDRYLRTLLIHGARSALRCAEGKPDRLLQWALRLKETKGFNVAACALANKLARVAWALVAHGRRYQPQGLTLAESASHE